MDVDEQPMSSSFNEVTSIDFMIHSSVNDSSDPKSSVITPNSSVPDSISSNYCDEDKASQTVFDNYMLGAKIDTMILRNSIITKPSDAVASS